MPNAVRYHLRVTLTPVHHRQEEKALRLLDAAGRWKSCRARIGKPNQGAITIQTGAALNYLDVAVLQLDG